MLSTLEITSTGITRDTNLELCPSATVCLGRSAPHRFHQIFNSRHHLPPCFHIPQRQPFPPRALPPTRPKPTPRIVAFREDEHRPDTRRQPAPSSKIPRTSAPTPTPIGIKLPTTHKFAISTERVPCSCPVSSPPEQQAAFPLRPSTCRKPTPRIVAFREDERRPDTPKQPPSQEKVNIPFTSTPIPSPKDIKLPAARPTGRPYAAVALAMAVGALGLGFFPNQVSGVIGRGGGAGGPGRTD